MPQPGDTIHGVITRITAGGNAIVDGDSHHPLNIGPISEDAVGTEVKIEYCAGTFHRCLTSSVTPPNYDAFIDLKHGKTQITVTVTHRTAAGHGIANLDREYMNIGPVTCDIGESVPVEHVARGYLKCVSESVQGPNYESWLETVTTSKNPVRPIIITTANTVNSQTTAKGYTINLGPLTCDSGDIVDVEFLEFPSAPRNLVGYVLTDAVTPDTYDEAMASIFESQLQHYLESVSTTSVTTNIDRLSDSGNGLFTYQDTEYNIGPTPESMVGDTLTVHLIGNTSVAFTDKSGWATPTYSRENISELVYQFTGRNSGDDIRWKLYGTAGYLKDQYSPETPTEHLSISTSSLPTSTPSSSTSASSTASYPTAGSSSTTPSTESTEYPPDLTELREQAENAATTTPQTTQETTTPGSRYSRAPEIKAYAKARADGVCEGCENPAPFLDKNGDPYLEIHHIHELGDGGADHPDFVIAICPTCHSRIHYGFDGEEYNDELKEKVTRTLSQQG